MGAPIPARPWLDELHAALPVSRTGADPEGVHRVRVALARIRVWLRLGDWHVLGDDARWLRQQAAAVRDLDVRLAQHPPPMVAAAWRMRWLGAHRAWVAALDHPRTAALLEALELLPPVPHARALAEVRRLERTVAARGRDAFDGGLARLHALRCAVRRLRVALEWSGLDSARVTALQDALGRACDAAIALKGAAGKGKTSAGFRERLERAQAAATRDAAAQWSKTKASLGGGS